MKKVVLTDGGMGQELIRRSEVAPTPLWSGRVLIDEPDLVRDLHARVHPRRRPRDHDQRLRGDA